MGRLLLQDLQHLLLQFDQHVAQLGDPYRAIRVELRCHFRSVGLVPHRTNAMAAAPKSSRCAQPAVWSLLVVAATNPEHPPWLTAAHSGRVSR